jgi:hypothetical protein
MALPDRVALLNNPAQTDVTGIDFAYVDPTQKQLDIYFLKDPAAVIPSLVNDLPAELFRIQSIDGGESIAEVAVTGAVWTVIDSRNVVRLTTATPGDFSYYRLHIEDNRIDPFYNDVRFSFKANCPSQFDCKDPAHICPPEPRPDYNVNYLARDFESYRQALLDFTSERYPSWKDRLEADAGMMLAELMSALGDEMAYYQDRVAREGYLETATQRRSIQRLARFVDYDIHDGLGASAWLDFQVSLGASGLIPAGTPVRDRNERIAFEAGAGLFETLPGFPVDSRLNALKAHIFDKSAACLPVGSTEVTIDGDLSAVLPAEPDKWMLLRTDPLDPSLQQRRWMIRVTNCHVELDAVEGVMVTRFTWDAAQATPFETDLATLTVHGNLVPSTSGETIKTQFRMGPAVSPNDPPEAIERGGPGDGIAFLHSLPRTEPSDPDYHGDLVWRGPDTSTARPEVRLFEALHVGPNWVEGEEWEWRRALLGTDSAEPSDKVFTLDHGSWRRIAGFRRIGGEFVDRDYATGDGVTLRFGDDEFGLVPADGLMFQATYRVGNGLRSNVTPGTLVSFNPIALPFIDSVTNPLAGVDGLDPEPAADVLINAPEAFRAKTFRAVRPEDYAEAAEHLSWVQRAGAEFRWTGSWLSCFVTPDPRGSFRVTPEQRTELEQQLDRFRQAGREAYAKNPVYANLDLDIRVCVAQGFFVGDVKQRVLAALFGQPQEDGTLAFFSPDRFTFGTPLLRSALEAAIQKVPGVRAVERILFRRRGWFRWRIFAQLVYRVAANEIIRIENVRELPERGSVRLVMEGGS